MKSIVAQVPPAAVERLIGSVCTHIARLMAVFAAVREQVIALQGSAVSEGLRGGRVDGVSQSEKDREISERGEDSGDGGREYSVVDADAAVSVGGEGGRESALGTGTATTTGTVSPEARDDVNIAPLNSPAVTRSPEATGYVSAIVLRLVYVCMRMCMRLIAVYACERSRDLNWSEFIHISLYCRSQRGVALEQTFSPVEYATLKLQQAARRLWQVCEL